MSQFDPAVVVPSELAARIFLRSTVSALRARLTGKNRVKEAQP